MLHLLVHAWLLVALAGHARLLVAWLHLLVHPWLLVACLHLLSHPWLLSHARLLVARLRHPWLHHVGLCHVGLHLAHRRLLHLHPRLLHTCGRHSLVSRLGNLRGLLFDSRRLLHFRLLGNGLGLTSLR